MSTIRLFTDSFLVFKLFTILNKSIFIVVYNCKYKDVYFCKIK